jgi:hypothetical protein
VTRSRGWREGGWGPGMGMGGGRGKEEEGGKKLDTNRANVCARLSGKGRGREGERERGREGERERGREGERERERERGREGERERGREGEETRTGCVHVCMVTQDRRETMEQRGPLKKQNKIIKKRDPYRECGRYDSSKMEQRGPLLRSRASSTSKRV